nr:hypothetical protein [Tanacetum cinerariifolium]
GGGEEAVGMEMVTGVMWCMVLDGVATMMVAMMLRTMVEMVDRGSSPAPSPTAANTTNTTGCVHRLQTGLHLLPREKMLDKCVCG